MAKKAAPPVKVDTATLNKVLLDFDRDERSHRLFAKKADRMYRAFRGVIEAGSEADGWQNKQAPPYVLQVIDTMKASLLDPNPQLKLGVRPRLAAVEDVEKYRQGLRANELILNEQLDNDHFAEKQGTFGLQGLITGLTVGRSSWRYEETLARSLKPGSKPVTASNGAILGEIPCMVPAKGMEVVRDDPTFTVRDVRDFIWQESATSLERCQRVFDREWFTFDELKELERSDWFGVNAGGSPVDDLKDNAKETSGHTDQSQREEGLFETDRTKGMVEVVTCYRRDPKVEGGLRAITFANRKVILRDKPSPYWLERLEHPFPFVVCSSMPDLFRIPGISEVEVIEKLQEVLWTLGNQRLDNLMLLNNFVSFVRDDHEGDIDIYPGAVNLVPGNPSETFQAWSPPVQLANVSLEAESIAKGDLQNIPGAGAALLGNSQSSSGGDTATEVSLMTSLAQKRIAGKKLQFSWALSRMGGQWLQMNQQFIRDDRVVSTVGMDGEMAFESVRAELLQGNYRVVPDGMDESLMRQERKAEASSRFQVFLQAAPVYQALKTPLNAKAFLDDFLEADGITDTARYYSAVPQEPLAQPGQQGPLGTVEPQGPGGVTSPLATSAGSPSNSLSQSPEVFMQRAGAATGGPNNV